MNGYYGVSSYMMASASPRMQAMQLQAQLQQQLGLQDDSREKFLSTTRPFEEIERLVLREDLCDVERVGAMLTSSNSSQRLAGIAQLAQLHKSYVGTTLPTDFVDLVDKLLGGTTAKTPRDQQAATAATLASIFAEKTSLPTPFVADNVIPLVMRMTKGADSATMQVWAKTFFIAVQRLPHAILKDKLLGFVGSLCEPSSTSAQQRAMCCAGIATLLSAPPPAPQSSSFQLCAGLLDRCAALCRDPDADVRACMLGHLPAIARAVGQQETRQRIVPLLVESVGVVGGGIGGGIGVGFGVSAGYGVPVALGGNTSAVSGTAAAAAAAAAAAIRRASLASLIGVVDLIDPETRDHVVIPAIKAICRDPPEEVIDTLAQQLGELITKVFGVMEKSGVQLLVQLFNGLALRKNNDVRRACAFNVPAVVASISGAHSALLGEVKDTFIALALDSHPPVRRAIVAGFHEVSRVVGKSHSGHVRETYIKLLKDSLEVVEPGVEHIVQTLSTLDTSQSTFLPLLLSAVMDCANTISRAGDWRLLQAMMRELAQMAQFFTSAQILEKIVPFLMEHMKHTYCTPLREAAAQCVCGLMNNGIRNARKRRDICEKLKDNFAKSSSCWDRVLFVNIVQHINPAVSKKLFKDTLWSAAVDLTQDNVPNVRLRICSVVPLLKQALIMPGDNMLLKRLTLALYSLQHDSDSDVSEAAEQAAQRFHLTECSTEPEEEDSRDSESVDDLDKKDESSVLNDKSDLWRRLAERDAEMALKAKIYGKLPKGRLSKMPLPPAAPGAAATGSSSFRRTGSLPPSSVRVVP
eukprot:TRINITY_DN3364_c0_g1_i1.p1 TRINITY_DN3364_c0_g1~~TRINITY_DN3364_c0_g1_i1.p1  ORF type:complete len:807 (-),score=204.48 TRINITY_DN3364_c0_g1_i1:76-2496(-)